MSNLQISVMPVYMMYTCTFPDGCMGAPEVTFRVTSREVTCQRPAGLEHLDQACLV